MTFDQGSVVCMLIFVIDTVMVIESLCSSTVTMSLSHEFHSRKCMHIGNSHKCMHIGNSHKCMHIGNSHECRVVTGKALRYTQLLFYF